MHARNVWDRFEQGAHPLGGFFDDTGAAIRAKYAQAKAKLQAVIGRFLTLRETIMTQQQRLGVALDRAEKQGMSDRAEEIRAHIYEGEQLLGTQTSLESRVAEAVEKMKEIEPEGLGVLPLVVVAGAAVLILGVAGAVVIHTQRTQSWNRKADLLEQGLISADDFASDTALFNIPASVWLVGLAGLGAWLYMQNR